MDEIIKISRDFLIGSLLIAALLLLGIIAYNLTNQPDLFIPPPESERKTITDLVENSNDIEALRKTCATFAKCGDQEAKYLDEISNRLNWMLIHLIVFLAFISCLSAYGYFSILRKAKKLKDETHSAL